MGLVGHRSTEQPLSLSPSFSSSRVAVINGIPARGDLISPGRGPRALHRNSRERQRYFRSNLRPDGRSPYLMDASSSYAVHGLGFYSTFGAPTPLVAARCSQLLRLDCVPFHIVVDDVARVRALAGIPQQCEHLARTEKNAIVSGKSADGNRLRNRSESSRFNVATLLKLIPTRSY